MKPLEGVLLCLLRDGASQPMSVAGFPSVQTSNAQTKFGVVQTALHISPIPPMPLVPLSVLNAELQSVGLMGMPRTGDALNAGLHIHEPSKVEFAFHRGSL